MPRINFDGGREALQFVGKRVEGRVRVRGDDDGPVAVLENHVGRDARVVLGGGADAARALAARAAAVAVAEVRPEPRPVWRGRRRYETRRLSCEHEDDIAATASGSSSSFTLIPHRGALSNSMDAYSARSARSSAGCGRENAA